MHKQIFFKISTLLLILIVLLLSPVFAAWVYRNYSFVPADKVMQNAHLLLNKFTYDDPGSVLPGGPGSGTTTPEETTPTQPPEETEPGGSEETTPEETTPVTPPPPVVEEGKNHYNMVQFVTGEIGEEGLNIVGGIIYRFIDRTVGPEYSEDNTLGGGNLPKEFEKFNSENLEFIVTFDRKNNPTQCYVYTYDHIEQDDSSVNGDVVVVYKTIVEPIGENGKWVATHSYKGYATVRGTSNKKVNWAPDLNTWRQGEIPN